MNEIVKRYRELYPGPWDCEPIDALERARRSVASANPRKHCEICPKLPGEHCGLNCRTVREAADALANDGISVTTP